MEGFRGTSTYGLAYQKLKNWIKPDPVLQHWNNHCTDQGLIGQFKSANLILGWGFTKVETNDAKFEARSWEPYFMHHPKSSFKVYFKPKLREE